MRFPNEIFLEIFKYLDILSCFRLLPTSYLFRLLLIPTILDFRNKDPGHAMTALYLSATCGDKELMKLVLIKGVEATITNGNNALQSSGKTFDVNYAVQVLVYLNSRSEIWGSCSEVSALHWAVMGYEGGLLYLLYKRGLSANMREEDAMRALHTAAFVVGGKAVWCSHAE